MTRLSRLYAVAESLRAAAPVLVAVAELARQQEVSSRTIQRDLQALMAAGLPIRWEEGRGGGWTVDAAMTLPPINLTAPEAVALMLAAAAAAGGGAPMGGAAQSAWGKIAGVLDRAGSTGVDRWRTRVAVLPASSTRNAAVIERATAAQLLVRLTYSDAEQAVTTREVEPIGLLAAGGQWYLIGWCRLRGGVRGFRLDRITAVEATTERVVSRDLADVLRKDAIAARSVMPASLG
ncbi:proteasome accessory factor B [Nakamurella sp. UYEF19]|uniref:helix-turn-helix transcriptional regulator n=1 Tax=Nakamurella sp. UYEF19 TaxID=1756392 RepID=UPI003390A954